MPRSQSQSRDSGDRARFARGRQIAIKGGSADLLLSDWLWVTRERALGDNLVFYPSSSTVGAVMVPANSTIRSVADLRGKKIAIAGGPLDKSWLLLQAWRAAPISICAGKPASFMARPPLLSEKACRASTTRR